MSKDEVAIDPSLKADGVSIVADELVIEMDPLKLGQGPAEAIRRAIVAGIRGISARGRDGHRLFNRTGHLADGIDVQSTGSEYQITAPGDRLEDPAVASRLAELVPAIRDPLTPDVVQAIVDTVELMIVVNPGRAR